MTPMKEGFEDGGFTGAFSSSRRCGLDLRSIRSNPVAAWLVVSALLALAIVFAMGGIAGYETGWARIDEDNFKPRSNIYLAILQAALESDPEEADVIPAGLLDLVAPTLPNGTISLDIKLGWYQRHSELRLNADDLPPTILAFLEAPSLDAHREIINEVIVEKRIMRIELYKENNVGGQCTGAIVMAALGISILAAFSALVAYMIFHVSKTQAAAQYCPYCYYVVRSGTIIGLLLMAACVAHYIALAYGTHNDTRESPYVQRAFIPWPSWAWVCGFMSACVWISIGIMSMKGMPPKPVDDLRDSSKMDIENKNTSSNIAWP